MKTTLHLLMGLPGSGKTTLAKIIQKQTKAVRMSSDDYRLLVFPEPTFTQAEHDNLYGLLDHNVEHLLQSGMSVIYDANLNRLHHRQEKYELAKKYGSSVILWWVQTPREVAKGRRMKEQDSTLLPEGETSERMFERIAEIIEEPDDQEPYIAVDGRSIDPDLVQDLIKKHI